MNQNVALGELITGLSIGETAKDMSDSGSWDQTPPFAYSFTLNSFVRKTLNIVA